MIKTYPKDSQETCSAHFSVSEFKCPCDNLCDSILLSMEMVGLLEQLRSAIGAPLRINSGYRCAGYQGVLRSRGYETAAGVSQHTLGCAADIESPQIPKTGAELEVLARQVGVKAVGVASLWIHIDMRNDKDRRWTYGT